MGMLIERKVVLTYVQAELPDGTAGKIDVEVFMDMQGYVNVVPSKPVTRLKIASEELKHAVEEITRRLR